MGKGKRLSEYERGQIDAFVESGMKIQQIASSLERSYTVVKNYVENREFYGQKNNGGRPTKLSDRDKRHIVQLASNESTSATQIKDTLQLPVSRQTVWRVMANSEVLKHEKMKKRPRMTDDHKARRLTLCKDWLETGQDWTRVIFSDEKKFNLDGPDGYAYYWHDIRKDEKVFSSRVQGGGSVMIWGCIGYNFGRLALVTTRMNAERYTEILESELLPFAPEIGGPTWQFQQDNASIHDAAFTRQWFVQQGVTVIPWPSCSPDLNPIENVWGLLARKVYVGHGPYRTVEELQAAIWNCWNQMDPLYFQKLIDGQRRRLIRVIEKQGGCIGY